MAAYSLPSQQRIAQSHCFFPYILVFDSVAIVAS